MATFFPLETKPESKTKLEAFDCHHWLVLYGWSVSVCL